MYISPMLLKKEEEPFNDDRYITELKLDGIRAIFSNTENKRIYTRHNTDITSRFPELLQIDLPKGIILDGELVVGDYKTGKPIFEDVMQRFSSEKQEKITRLSVSKPATFCAFDILYIDGRNVCNLSLLKRKEILEESFKNNERITKTKFIENNGIKYFDLVKESQLEGIVLKRKESIYEVGRRSDSWIKVKNYSLIDALIVGFTKKEFNLLITTEEGKSLGAVELVPKPIKRVIAQYGREYKTYENEKNVYFKNSIQANFKYLYITRNGFLREPIFNYFTLNKGSFSKDSI